MPSIFEREIRSFVNVKSIELNGSPRPIHVGMDVHKETIVRALAWQNPQTQMLRERTLGVVANNPNLIERQVNALRSSFGGRLSFVYEAGACGYTLYRQLCVLDVECEIIALPLIPHRSGDRVKTDRRDAQQLARLYMAGLLTPIWIPDVTQEAMCDLTRCRFNLKARTSQQKVRIQHFLLRHDLRYDGTRKRRTQAHRAWSKDLKLTPPVAHKTLHMELDTLEDLERRLASSEKDIKLEIDQYYLRSVVDDVQSVRGIDFISAVALLTEIGDMRRFPTASAFMSYLGLTPRERAWAGQKTLNAKYRKFGTKGKHQNIVVTAVARGLAGYLWDIACRAMSAIDAEAAQATS